MFSRSINERYRAARMMIVGDATALSFTIDDSRGVIYERNIVIIQATEGQ
jgi:hypothetical protein